MASCNDFLDADILKNCDVAPVGGLEADILLFNRADIDYDSITYDGTNSLLVTNFQLKAGKTGFLIEGIKQSNSASSELVLKDYGNKYKHLISGVMLNPSVANMASLEKVMDGGAYAAIVNRKWKGTGNSEAFILLGIDSGLVASSSTWNSGENDGVELFELASEDGFEEGRKPRIVLETDFATTLTAFEAKFAQAAA